MKTSPARLRVRAVFLYSKNLNPARQVNAIFFSLSLTSEKFYSKADRYVLSSVVLSPLAERQKIKNIRSYKQNEKGYLLNYKVR